MGEASSGLLSFSLSCVFDISSFTSKKKTLVPATQAMIGNDKGPTLERVCACQSTVRTWRGQARGGGDKGSFVLHWFFYNEFEDAQEQAPTQVPNHDKFVDAQTTLWPSLTLRRTNLHLDSYRLKIAHTLLPGDHCSLLSLGRYQSDGMLQI